MDCPNGYRSRNLYNYGKATSDKRQAVGEELGRVQQESGTLPQTVREDTRGLGGEA